MTPRPRVRLSADASVAALDGEAVVLHLKSGRFFRVNRSGAPLLAALGAANGTTREELVDTLVTTFRAEVARATLDVDAWLDLLAKAGLLTEVASASTP